MKKIRHILTIAIVAILTSSLFTVVSLMATPEEKYFFKVILTANPGTSTDVCSILADEFKKIGIDAEVITIESASLYDRFDKMPLTYEEGGCDTGIIGKGFLSASSLRQSLYPGGTYTRRYGWSNYEVGQYIDEAEAADVFTEKQSAYFKALKLAVDDFAVIPIWERTINTVSKTYVMGLESGVFKGPSDAYYHYIEGKTPEDSTTLTYALPFTLTEFNTMISGHTGEFFIGGTYMCGGCLYDEWFYWPMLQRENPPEPRLCTGFNVSTDRLTYMLHFRDDVTFSDGVKFNVTCLKWMYDLKLNPEFPGYSPTFEEYIDSVEIVDEFTLCVKLKKPNPDFPYDSLYVLALPWHLLKDVPPSDMAIHWSMSGVGGTPIGVGPYKIKEFAKDEYLILEARDDYWRGRPNVDTIIAKMIPDKSAALLAFKAGEVDVLNEWYGFDRELKELSEEPDVKVTKGPHPNIQFLWVNHNYGPLSNINVRKAMAYAIPRENIVQDIFDDVPYVANQMVSRLNALFFDPNLSAIPYDIEMAKTYMEKAGYDYDLLISPPEPMSPIMPAGIGLIAGLIIGAVVIYFLKKSSSP